MPGFGDDDSNRLRLMRSPQFANESLDALIIASKSMHRNQVLPDTLAIAASAQIQFDDFPKWFAKAWGRRGRRQWDGLFFRNQSDKVGGHIIGRF